MSSNVVRFIRGDCGADDVLKARLLNLSAIFGAIHAGELLSVLPECPIARGHYLTAVKLLAFVEAEIQAICIELD